MSEHASPSETAPPLTFTNKISSCHNNLDKKEKLENSIERAVISKIDLYNKMHMYNQIFDS